MSNKDKFHWGILGTGWIADRFVSDLTFLDDHAVLAVGSRNGEKAMGFASAHQIPRAYGSYQDLVNDPDLDAIYVSTPHPYHHPHTILALNAGKAVLTEKPFAMDTEQAQEMVDLAREKKLFLMEAMWTRFLPHVLRIKKLIDGGRIGKLISFHADHGQWFAENDQHRLFSKKLGGGALLDLGIYPVSFAHFLLGNPSKITAVSTPAFTGVDAQTSVIFQYVSGAHAVLNTTLAASSSNRALILGTEARIEVGDWFYAPSSFRVVSRDGSVIEKFDQPFDGHGLREEAAEVARCVRAGLTESPGLPWEETLRIMKSLDEIRRQIGLTYPTLG